MKFVIPGLILIMIAGGILYYFVFTGVLMVSSSRPVETAIQIDGIEAGATPFKKRVRPGVYQIKVYKEGFEPWQGEVKVTGTAPGTIVANLRFLVRSEPTGAKFKINGKDAGITDMAIDLAPGLYEFEFQKKGFRKIKFRALIPKNVNEPLPAAPLTTTSAEKPYQEEFLQKEQPAAPEFGSIQITSTPDAQVSIDGTPKGETPLTIKKYLVGSYVLKLSREGHKELRQTIYVNKGETTRIAAELKPESEN